MPLTAPMGSQQGTQEKGGYRRKQLHQLARRAALSGLTSPDHELRITLVHVYDI